MNDNRFIELVNLYIDRQITAAEAAELEAEMQDNPRRRAVYRQYCQLHSATKQVYDRFRANATEFQPAPAGGRAVIADFDNRGRKNWIHYVGGLATAACLALVLVRYSNNTQPAAAAVAKVEPKPAVQTAAAETAMAHQPPSLISLRREVTPEPGYSALLTALREEEQQAFASPEIQASRLPSLFDDGVFEVKPVLPVNGQRTFHSKQAPAQPAEFTAFQFQR
jgi:hypothetical protein